MFNLYSLKVFNSIYDPYQALLLPLKAIVLCTRCTHDFCPKLKQKSAAYTRVFTVVPWPSRATGQ